MREKASLEETLDAKVVTTEDLADLLKHVTAPKEKMEGYNSAGFQFIAQVKLLLRNALYISKSFLNNQRSKSWTELNRDVWMD